LVDFKIMFRVVYSFKISIITQKYKKLLTERVYFQFSRFKKKTFAMKTIPLLLKDAGLAGGGSFPQPGEISLARSCSKALLISRSRKPGQLQAADATEARQDIFRNTAYILPQLARSLFWMYKPIRPCFQGKNYQVYRKQ